MIGWFIVPYVRDENAPGVMPVRYKRDTNPNPTFRGPVRYCLIVDYEAELRQHGGE